MFLFEDVDFDLYNRCQSHYFHGVMNWSHGHYRHFAPDGFPQNHYKSQVFDKSVGFQFFKSLGLKFGTILDGLT